MRLSIIAFVLCSVSQAFASDKITVLALEPTSEQIDAATLQTIGGLMAVRLSKVNVFEVTSSRDVDKMLGLEEEKRLMDCTRDDSCLAELAGAMGAEVVVFGDAGTLGEVLVLNVTFFNARRGRALKRVSIQTPGIDDLQAQLETGLQGAIEEVLSALYFDERSGVQFSTRQDIAKELGIWTERDRWLAWFVGAGAAVAAVGVGVDFALWEKNNKFDGKEAVGPAMYGVALGLVATGIIGYFTGEFDDEKEEGAEEQPDPHAAEPGADAWAPLYGPAPLTSW